MEEKEEFRVAEAKKNREQDNKSASTRRKKRQGKEPRNHSNKKHVYNKYNITDKDTVLVDTRFF